MIMLFFSPSVVKLFAQNREDRKRVEKALDISGLPSGKVRKF
jgi:phosphatidylinositol phospholipase C beta